MGKLFASIGLSFLVGCGGDLEDRVDSSVSGVAVSTMKNGCDFSPHNLIEAYKISREIVLKHGLKTKSMERMYKMAENQMDVSNSFYNRCNNVYDAVLALAYASSAVNWIVELQLQQEDSRH